MSRLVCKMRAPILNLDNTSVRIRFALPFFVGNLLTLATPIDALYVIIGWVFYVFFFGEFTQVLFPILTRALARDATDECIAF